MALETNPRPAKQLKIDALSSYNALSLLGIEYEDEPNTTSFEDIMEECNYMLEDESFSLFFLSVFSTKVRHPNPIASSST